MFNGNTFEDFDDLDKDLAWTSDCLSPWYYLFTAFVQFAAAPYAVGNQREALVTFFDSYPRGGSAYFANVAGFIEVMDDLLGTFRKEHAEYRREQAAIRYDALRATRAQRLAALRPYTKAKISHRTRRIVFERDAYRCRICGGYEALCVDHIIPESKGGASHLDNYQTLCRSCNCRKGARV